MSDLLTSEFGTYVMSVLVGVGIGLVYDARSRRIWVGSMLVVSAFVIQVSTFKPSDLGGTTTRARAGSHRRRRRHGPLFTQRSSGR